MSTKIKDKKASTNEVKMQKKKKVNVEDFGMTEEQMKRFADGARFLFKDGK